MKLGTVLHTHPNGRKERNSFLLDLSVVVQEGRMVQFFVSFKTFPWSMLPMDLKNTPCCLGFSEKTNIYDMRMNSLVQLVVNFFVQITLCHLEGFQ